VRANAASSAIKGSGVGGRETGGILGIGARAARDSVEKRKAKDVTFPGQKRSLKNDGPQAVLCDSNVMKNNAR
jgi:hypothetical protein